MRKTLSVGLVLIFAVSAVAQEKETTKVTTKETTLPSGVDLLGPPLWSMQDAVPVPQGGLDLRLGFKWVTGSGPYNGGDSDDDFVIIPHLVWGFAQNWELAISNSAWVGDGGDVGPLQDGNYDSNLAILWRLADQNGWVPAIALQGAARIPTGDGSSGIDGELRLILTSDHDNGIRSHINAFAKTVNGNNDGSTRYVVDNIFDVYTDGDFPDNRHFQWGFVLGLDGPLCADGAVRWVADYVHRSSYHYGNANVNLLELGFEWKIADAHSLGMAALVGLDDNGDTPNAGAGLTYSYAIAR